MSIQWALVAGFLYIEIGVVLLLVLPLASPRRWQSFFRSRFLSALSSQATYYFYIILFALILFLLDAIREMRKYSNNEPSKTEHGHAHQLDLEMQLNMRLFRAQRNFYISGFALFLSLVIRRLVNLISTLATVQAQSEAALKQAEGASKTARNLMNTGGAGDNEETKKLKNEVEILKKEVDKISKDKDAVVKQSENLSKEYDRLTEEYSKLQKKAEAIVGDSSNKKAD